MSHDQGRGGADTASKIRRNEGPDKGRRYLVWRDGMGASRAGPGPAATNKTSWQSATGLCCISRGRSGKLFSEVTSEHNA